MIIDCVTFFNELDLLELRLRLLDTEVDKFVIVESDKTQSLKDKPLNFWDNRARFAEFEHKIVYAIHRGHGQYQSYNDSWVQEQSQREEIGRVLQYIGASDSDQVLISDLDEIPNIDRAIIEDIREFEGGVYTIPNKFFAYYLNMQGFDARTGREKYSDGTIVTCMKQIRQCGVSQLWADKHLWPKLYGMSGWHFSWLGGPQAVREKALACIEPFDKSCVPSEAEMEAIFKRRVIEEGFFNINHPNDNSVRMEVVNSLPIGCAGMPNKYWFTK